MNIVHNFRETCIRSDSKRQEVENSNGIKSKEDEDNFSETEDNYLDLKDEDIENDLNDEKKDIKNDILDKVAQNGCEGMITTSVLNIKINYVSE